MRIFGHPVHPVIVHFPIACWALAVLRDGAWFFHENDLFYARSAFYLHGAGLSAAVLAVLTGLADLAALGKKPEAASTATAHILFMVIAVSVSGASFFGRMRLENYSAQDFHWVYAAGLAAAAFVFVGGFFGGSLVYRFGFGGDAGN